MGVPAVRKGGGRGGGGNGGRMSPCHQAILHVGLIPGPRMPCHIHSGQASLTEATCV